RWGTTEAQETMTCTLGDLADPQAALDLRPPLVTVIGDVVSLRDQLRWFDVPPALEAAIAPDRADEPLREGILPRPALRPAARALRPLYTAKLPPFGEERRDLRRKSAGASLENQGNHFRLSRVCALVDEEAGRTFDLAGPEVALPSPDANETETIELDVAVVAATDVPEEDRFAVAVVR